MEYGDDYSRAQLAMESLTKILPSSKNYSPDYSKKVFGPKPYTFPVLGVRTLGDQPLGPTEVKPGVLSHTARGRPSRNGIGSFGESWESYLQRLPTLPKSQLKHASSSSASAKSVASASSKASNSTIRAESPRPAAINWSSGAPGRHHRVRTTISQKLRKIKGWVASN